jgi:hypothetical protein
MSFKLNVSYKGKKTITETASEPSIQFPKKDGMFYTILMLDPDAPATPWLHMLRMNVSAGADAERHGDVVMSYVRPSPPPGTGIGPQGTHRYITSIYEQHGYVTPPKIQERANFPIQTFIHTYGLRNIGSSIFTVDSNPVRKQIQGGKRKTRRYQKHRMFKKQTKKQTL